MRPTADRTREAVFNILTQGKLPWRKGPESGESLTGIRVLDAFAGTGALGLEALSRGAERATFMESQAAALDACRGNIDALGEAEHCAVLQCDVLRPPPAPAPCDLVLMDPPYNQDLAGPGLAALARTGWLAPESLAVIELMVGEPFEAPDGFEVVDERRYGKARVVFLTTRS